MDRMDPHELFPMVFHQISVENYACAELPLPEDLFHKSGVGLHVIYHLSKEERLCYTAWCYTKDLPLLRFIRNVSLPVNTNSLQEANQHVVDHICNDERLPSDFERFLDWAEDVDYLKATEGTPLGSAVAERFDCFEFCLPECVFGRSDIKLQVTYRSTNAKKNSVRCLVPRGPFTLSWPHLERRNSQKRRRSMSGDSEPAE